MDSHRVTSEQTVRSPARHPDRVTLAKARTEPPFGRKKVVIWHNESDSNRYTKIHIQDHKGSCCDCQCSWCGSFEGWIIKAIGNFEEESQS